MGGRLTCLLAIIIVLPVVSASYSTTQVTVDGTAWFDCEDSWASIEDDSGNIIANGTGFTEVIDSGNHTFHIGDSDKCQGVIPITEELPNLRPAPSTEFVTFDHSICLQDGFDNNCEGVYISGD
jgi:hypothetical protein